jgi:hypothetical protein
MVVYIPIYHCIMKLEQMWKNKLVIGIHFHFATTRHNATIIQKDCEGLDLMVVYPWNFAHGKRQQEKSSFLKFSISFQVVKFIPNVLKTFVNTLWCYNNETFDLLKL